MMINLLSLFSSLNFKKRIINPNFNEHEKSIIHESSKKSKSKTKKSVYLSQFRTHFFLSFKLFNKPKNNLFKLFFFQRYYNPKIYRELAACYFERGADTRSGAIREHHLARFLLWAGQRNRKTTVSNRCR